MLGYTANLMTMRREMMMVSMSGLMVTVKMMVTMTMVITRCRGVCSSSSRPVACVATKTSQKVVTMAFR